MIIQGRRSHDYVTRHKGSKLRAAEKLIRQGIPISIISEPEFFNLVWRNRPRSRPSQRRAVRRHPPGVTAGHSGLSFVGPVEQPADPAPKGFP